MVIDFILIIGGINISNQRISVSNSKRLGTYDPVLRGELEQEILLVDQTSQYAGILEQCFLPYSDYRWLSEADILSLDVGSLPVDSGTGKHPYWLLTFSNLILS